MYIKKNPSNFWTIDDPRFLNDCRPQNMHIYFQPKHAEAGAKVRVQAADQRHRENCSQDSRARREN